MQKLKKILVWTIILSSSIWAFFFYKEVDPYPGKIVITFATNGGVTEERAWEEIIKNFESKHPHIKVKLMLVPLKYDEKLLTLLAANIAPDIFICNPVEMVPKDVLLPYDNFIKNDKDIDTADLLPGMEKLGHIFGHTYDLSTSVGPIALFYNVNHFKEAGLKTPNEYAAEGKWNFDTFLQCCKKLVKRDKNGNILRWAYRVYANYMIFTYMSINGGLFYKDGTFQVNFDDPKVYEGLQKFADLSLKYDVSPGIIAEEQSGVSAAWKDFQRGMVSMMHSGPWMIGRLKNMKEPYDVAPPPIEAENNGRPNIIANSATGIWKGSKHPQEAYLFLKHLAGKESRIIWSRLGFDLPAYKSLWANKELWVDTKIIPKHFDVFYDLSISVLKEPISRFPFITTKVNNYFSKEVWEQIRQGKKSAKEILKEWTPRIQQATDEKMKLIKY